MRRVVALLLGVLLLPPWLQGGVTLITHGLNGNVDDWIIPMAERIPGYPSFPGTTYSCYEIFFVNTGSGLAVTNRLLSGVAPTQSDSGQILIKLDWNQLANNDYSTDEVAAMVAPRLWDEGFMPGLDGRSLASWPLHLLGHSRGGSLVSELSRLLGEQGIWVDHVTTWDPHPLNNDGFDDSLLYSVVDATVTTYENVLFADNYFQLLSTLVYGEPVFGAYVRQLTNLDGGYGGLFNFSAAHSDVHLWYHGTIELTTPATDTGADITASERQSWWTSFEAQGARAGFLYSRIGGGDRFSTNRPAGEAALRDGMNQWWDFGAGLSDNRTPLPANQGLWPNLIQFDVTSSLEFEPGTPLEATGFYQYGQDAAHPFSLTFRLDPDLNPINQNEWQLATIGGVGTGIDRVTPASWSLPTAELALPPGTYRLLGVISDGTRERFLYAPQSLTLLLPPRLMVLGASEQGFGLSVQAAAGQTLRIDAAYSLNQWAPLATNTLAGETWEFWDAGARLEPRRFYRAVLLP